MLRQFVRAATRCKSGRRSLSTSIESQIATKMAGDEVLTGDAGNVLSLHGSVVRVAGVHDCVVGSVVSMQDTRGLVFNLERDTCAVALLSEAPGLQVGAPVQLTAAQHSFPAGPGMLGRVVGATGEPVDGLGALDEVEFVEFLSQPPSKIITRASESVPLPTGLGLIDAFQPLWRGQRVGLLGPVAATNTRTALQIISNMCSDESACAVYVCIGKSEQQLQGVVDMLAAAGVADRVAIVVAFGSDPSALQWIAPFAACSIAESLRDAGRDTLLVYDDLFNHASAYELLAPHLNRPAVVNLALSLHAGLMERSTCRTAPANGGSLSALALVETTAESDEELHTAGGNTDCVGKAAVSMCDRTFFLDAGSAAQGLNPPIDVLRAPRGDTRGQPKAISQVVDRLRDDIIAGKEAQRTAKLSASLGLELELDVEAAVHNNARLQAFFDQAPQQNMSQAQLWLTLALCSSQVPPDEVLTSFGDSPSSLSSLKARVAAFRRAGKGATTFQHDSDAQRKNARVRSHCKGFYAAFCDHVEQDQPQLLAAIEALLKLEQNVSVEDVDSLMHKVDHIAREFYGRFAASATAE